MPKKSDGLSKNRRSPFWYASFTDERGQRTRRSTGTTDRKEAQALLAKWRLEAREQRLWGKEPERGFDELMLHYLKESQPHVRSPRTRLNAARVICKAFTGRLLSDITTADVRRYALQRRAEGAAASTVNKEVGLLSSALNHARTVWGWNVLNVAAGCRQREPQGRVRWITRDEATRLIAAAARNPKAPYLADLLRLALHTGLRRGELLGLQWRQVDLGRRLIVLEPDQTKAARRRSVPLNDEAVLAIRGRLLHQQQHQADTRWTHVFTRRNGEPLGEVKRSFHAACRDAGIEDFRLHDCRHTFAAWLVQAGVPLAEVRDLLGHATIQMTERYAHLAPGATRDAVERLANFGRTPITLATADVP